MSDSMKINSISQATKDTILRKTAYALPDRPSASGMKPKDIKRAFYMGLTDEEDSIIAEMERIIRECNEIIGSIVSKSFTHIDDKDNPHNVTKAQIGLGKVDNTSDANKPVSVMQQYELNKKVNKTDIQDNVVSSDADKPLSAYRGKLLDERITSVYETLLAAINNVFKDSKDYADNLVAGVVDGSPEAYDTLKEIATWIANDESGAAAYTARITALENNKVDKESGKALSSNDFTDNLKVKLEGLSEDAQKNVQSDWNESNSGSDAYIKNKPSIPKNLSEMVEDSSHRVVSDSEKTTWNNKQNKLSFDDNPTANSSNPVKSGGVKVALDSKVDKVDGKQLSSNDYTDEDKMKIANLGTSSTRNVGLSAGDIPLLNSNGKLDENVVPAVAITDTFEASSESEMLALTAQKGDICIRSDVSKTYILKTEPASSIGNWKVLKTPTDSVSSVNGKTGSVSLSSQDLTDAEDLVRVVEGKGLSSNDYTTAEKSKLAGIESGAKKNVQSDWNSTDTNSDAYIKNKPTIPSALSQMSQDSTHRVVTDNEKQQWSNKSNFDGNYKNLTNKPVINTNNSDTLGTEEAEELTRDNPVNLHKISKTGRYDDLIGQPVFNLDGTTLTITL